MEKYGVNTTNDTKTASQRTTCPECGQLAKRHGRVVKCPQCGTKPFEPKEKEQ